MVISSFKESITRLPIKCKPTNEIRAYERGGWGGDKDPGAHAV